jgi:hypothetical protein
MVISTEQVVYHCCKKWQKRVENAEEITPYVKIRTKQNLVLQIFAEFGGVYGSDNVSCQTVCLFVCLSFFRQTKKYFG